MFSLLLIVGFKISIWSTSASSDRTWLAEIFPFYSTNPRVSLKYFLSKWIGTCIPVYFLKYALTSIVVFQNECIWIYCRRVSQIISECKSRSLLHLCFHSSFDAILGYSLIIPWRKPQLQLNFQSISDFQSGSLITVL